MSMPPDAEVNLDYRPSSYFWPHGLEKHLLSRVKGERRRKELKALIDSGHVEEVPDFLASSSLSNEERQAIGRIHPSFMGGEYLPDIGEKEVAIARISIRSTTGDVTSVYARRGKRRIYYRVVDEYEGETLTGKCRRTSVKPLSLGELYAFFVGAWDLMGCLEMNYEDDVNGMLGFFRGSSEFYGQFDALLRQRVEERYAGAVVPAVDSPLATSDLQAMDIALCVSSNDASLEHKAPRDRELSWELVAQGDWAQDTYHSGYISYFIAQAGPGEWLLKSAERNALLDDVTEEDVEEGRINDDQAQAIWGSTLEEAQNHVYEQIVAVCSRAPVSITVSEMGKRLCQKVFDRGGKDIPLQGHE